MRHVARFGRLLLLALLLLLLLLLMVLMMVLLLLLLLLLWRMRGRDSLVKFGKVVLTEQLGRSLLPVAIVLLYAHVVAVVHVHVVWLLMMMLMLVVVIVGGRVTHELTVLLVAAGSHLIAT